MVRPDVELRVATALEVSQRDSDNGCWDEVKVGCPWQD